MKQTTENDLSIKEQTAPTGIAAGARPTGAADAARRGARRFHAAAAGAAPALRAVLYSCTTRRLSMAVGDR